MAPLPTGSCTTCSMKDVKLRTNPFTNEEQCEDCCKSEIIGITDLKKKYKLKDGDLNGLQTVTESQPIFVGGPARRWYLVKEIQEKTAEIAAEQAKDPREKRGPGRPKKTDTATSTNAEATVATDQKGLKRKRSASVGKANQAESGGEDGGQEDGADTAAAKKPKPKAATKSKLKATSKASLKVMADSVEAAPPAKKRGRPPRKIRVPSQ